MKFLVTGGAGFIGSQFVKFALEQENTEKVFNLDKLTYAGNLSTLKSVENHAKHEFIKGDISDASLIQKIMKEGIDVLVNFAAETHVDRSIQNAKDFIRTDMEGVYVLLEACKERGVKKIIQVSTDEVYGSIAEGAADETYPLMPSNPYSASKAGGDRLAYSYFKTYDLPVIITRTSNNYGPYQYPEKLIPLFITNAIENKRLPMYGDGLYRRDWIHVLDHCLGIWLLLEKGVHGEVYNITSEQEMTNLDLTHKILDAFQLDTSSIETVQDRPGHDRRYAVNASKIKQLGWQPSVSFEKGLSETISWYRNNEDWWKPIKEGDFKNYYKLQYQEVS